MSKRIVFTVTNDLSFDQRMIRICSTLSDEGYCCLLVGRRLKTSVPLLNRKFEQKRLNCFFARGPFFYIEFNFRLLIFLMFTKLHGVCSIDADTALAGLLLTKMRRKKWLFDAHELFPEVPEVKDRKWVKSIWRTLEKWSFKNADAAYTVGFALSEYFENRYARTVQVVRNIPVLNRDAIPNPDTDKFILYQGALNKGRGLENLITAMEFIPCKLKLAGEGDLSRELRNLTATQNLQDKVQFLGFVQPEQLKLLTASAWLGINVSENEGMSYYLSMNNKFFDYIHAGLPSLINDFPEYSKLNSQFHVGVITQCTVQDISEKANALLADDVYHKKLSNNCLIARESLNWEIEKLKLIHIYNEIFEK